MLNEEKMESLENGVNQGVIAPTVAELANATATSSFTPLLLVPNGNWLPFLSSFDFQSTPTFDTLGCNVFAGDHCVEAYLNRLGSTLFINPVTGKNEVSDRKMCIDTGLNGTQGSSQEQLQDSTVRFGYVADSLWTFTDNMTKQEFFSNYPIELIPKGEEFLTHFDFKFKLVPTDKQSLQEALKYAPVKLFVGTGSGFNNGDPFVIPRTNNPMGHAVTLYAIDDTGFRIDDQYAPFLKTLASDYIIYYAFQTILIPKGNNDMQLTIGADGKTYYLEGDKGKLGFADEASLAKIQSLTSLAAQPSSPAVPQVGIFEQGIVIHN